MKNLKKILSLFVFLAAVQLNAQSHRWDEDDDDGYDYYHDQRRKDRQWDRCCNIDQRELRSLALQKRKINKTKRLMLRDGYLDRREVRTLGRMRFKLHRQIAKAHHRGCHRFGRQ